MIILLEFALYLNWKQTSREISPTYAHPTKSQENDLAIDPRPFSSINGKTYTFVWCQGADKILIKNRVYYSDQTEVQKSGKTLSQLCQK